MLNRQFIIHNVFLYVVEKPEGFTFRQDQAVELAMNQPSWHNDKHSFTMISLPGNPRLEFIIKCYPVAHNPEHSNMKEQLGFDIEVGDSIALTKIVEEMNEV